MCLTISARYSRRFINHWEFVRYAREQHLDLDLSSPPNRPNRRESLKRMVEILSTTSVIALIRGQDVSGNPSRYGRRPAAGGKTCDDAQ